jgi:cytosine/adenosine deaminase-related metal-dependent hydrolase
MCTALLSSRGKYFEGFTEKGKIPSGASVSVQDVYDLGAIKGARALGMEAQIGSLEEGKLVDILVYDMVSPGIVSTAQRDPAAAIVMHSCARDVGILIVDGVVREEKWELVAVDVGGEGSGSVRYCESG